MGDNARRADGHAAANQISVELLLLLFTAIGSLTCGSGYITCIQNMKLVTN